MVELITSIIFIGSVAGAGTIIARKMPQATRAAALSRDAKLLDLRGTIKDWFIAKIKNNQYLKDFSWIDFVQKRLLKVRLVVLKAENKINDYMISLRKHADDQKKKDEALLDNYWHDLKTIVKNKKPLYKRNEKTSAIELEALAEDKAAVAAEKPAVDAKMETATTKAEPMIGRVVMPDQALPRQSHNKRKHNSKKKRLKDPFKW